MAELLRRAQEADDEEDRRYGKDKRGDELPEELAFREGRLRKIREAKAALEAEALAEAEPAEREGRNHPGVPADKAQRNFTDPDSRIMPSPGGRDFQQSYNCQAVVDSAHQVIVAARATNQPSDKQQAVVMVVVAIGNVGTAPREVSADAEYCSAKAVDALYDLGVNPFVAPEKTRHGWVPPPAPRGRIPQGLSARDRMRRKLRTKRGRERYALGMETMEPVFGQIKQGRGFRQFLLRGLAKVNREWLLICTGHNLLKLFRFGEGKPGKARATGPAGNNRDWHGTATRGIFRLLTAYTCPPRTRMVAVGWPQLNPCSQLFLGRPAEGPEGQVLPVGRPPDRVRARQWPPTELVQRRHHGRHTPTQLQEPGGRPPGIADPDHPEIDPGLGCPPQRSQLIQHFLGRRRRPFILDAVDPPAEWPIGIQHPVRLHLGVPWDMDDPPPPSVDENPTCLQYPGNLNQAPVVLQLMAVPVPIGNEIGRETGTQSAY